MGLLPEFLRILLRTLSRVLGAGAQCALADDTDFGNGYNWLIRDLPHLVEIGADTVMVVRGTRSTNWFDLIDGVYVGRYGAILLPLPPGEGWGEGGSHRYAGDEAVEHRSPHAPRGEIHHAERDAYDGQAAVSPTYYLPTYAQTLDISGATIVEQTEALYDAARTPSKPPRASVSTTSPALARSRNPAARSRKPA